MTGLQVKLDAMQQSLKWQPKMKLSEFSEYLANFDASNQIGVQPVELPGQYTGLVKPQPEARI